MARRRPMFSVLTARRTFARFACQFPDNPRLSCYLYRIKIPTQIIWGERDGLVAPAHGHAFHEGITGSKFTTIPNAGHLPHVEARAFALILFLIICVAAARNRFEFCAR
jgi:pimeloyl-ACP methyl ester carboxylesterase